ncbi:C6orf48 isoform 10 [Pan troglodytes]|uniref:C6orf48 isoform 1 n=3 Tax=Pan TaxID=9596 RepID=A0A6D2WWQ9_PANTR|nr:C6orf48 isoform 1 [Pan troglodytes]PNI76658.1 C6orf48 isoform 2 [Pan troglodytes]PNI76659.1 C6orf48 isoform 3 [Pan troglodytes]PNI76660.1 C6orf48 isoform 4 [Pan troglodytes]PNI76661.1 C6orf48 isoform 5 [Pan troglodytes]
MERSFVWLSCLDSDSCNLTFRLGEVESHACSPSLLWNLLTQYLLPGAGHILRTYNFPVLSCVSSCRLIGGKMPEN